MSKSGKGRETEKRPEKEAGLERKEKEKEVQQKYIEMQLVDAEMKQMQKQLVALDNQTLEIREVIEYLNELSALDAGREMFVPLTSGVFVRAELKDKDKILMNVGGNTVVTKTTAEGKELISRQLKEVEKVREQLLAEFQRLAFRLERLEKELMSMVS